MMGNDNDGKDPSGSCTNTAMCSEGSADASAPYVQVFFSTHSLYAFRVGDAYEDHTPCAVGVALRVSHDDAWSCQTEDHPLGMPWDRKAQAMPDEYGVWRGVCVTQGSEPRRPSPLPYELLDGDEHAVVTEDVLGQACEPEWLDAARVSLYQQVMAENDQLKKEKQAYSDIMAEQKAHIALQKKNIENLEKEKALSDRRKQEAEQHTRQALEQLQVLARKNDEQNDMIMELKRRISSGGMQAVPSESQSTGEDHALSMLSSGLEVLRQGVQWMAIDGCDAHGREQVSAGMLSVQEEQAQALRDKSNQDALCIERMMDANRRLADAHYHASDVEEKWLRQKSLWDDHSRKSIAQALQSVWRKK